MKHTNYIIRGVFTSLFLFFPSHFYADTEVGTIAGNLSVSETGAATYVIPLNSLSSPYGLSPSLSLAYNSQKGNGIIGYGWGISGLSSITIGPRTVYFDGAAEGLYEGEDNAYYLDGMRLILASGENGKEGATYRTEAEQYSIITIDSVLAETPASFTIKRNDGSTYHYGSLSGRMMYSDSACYQWALDYMEDRLGNYTIYDYAQDSLVLYPTAIHYGQNVHANEGGYSIEFSYTNRNDSLPIHCFDKTKKFSKILSQINCKIGTNIYRRYDLTYETHVYSHLVSIKEIGLQNSSYPQTTFEWDNLPNYSLDTSSPTVESLLLNEFSDMYFFAADTDNNGRSELLGLYNSTGTENPYFYVTLWNQGNNDGHFYNTTSYSTQSGISIHDMYTAYRTGGTLAHSSHRQDNSIILPYFSDLSGDCHMVFNCIKENSNLSYPMRSSATNACYTISDIDNDAMDDIVLVEQAKLSGTYPATIIRFNLSQNSLSYTDFSMNLTTMPTQIYSADINCDGMTDLLVCTTLGFYIYWNNAGTFSDNDRYYNAQLGECDVLKFGDINGDGLPDIIANQHNSTSWICAVNQGIISQPFAFCPITILQNMGASNNGKNESYCFMQDMNGDGKSDLIVGVKRYQSDNFLSAQMVVLESNGEQFQILDSHTFPNQATFPSLSHIVQGDFDGDGILEILYYGGIFHSTSTEVGWRKLKLNGYLPSTNYITTITNGLGTIQHINYGLLTDNNLYEVSSSSLFPLLTLRSPVSVTRRIETIAGSDTLWTNYKYVDAIYHWQGKGFLGFKKMISITHTGDSTILQNSVNDTYFVLYKTSKKTYAENGSLWKNGSSNTYLEPIGSKSYRIQAFTEDYDDEINGFYDHHSLAYDSYGLASYELMTDEAFSSTTYYTYWQCPTPNSYIKNLPSTIEVEKSGGTLGEEESERTEYTRDNTTGQPLSCRKYRNGTLLETTLYTYDMCGRVLTETSVYGNSTDSLTTTYVYNTSGRLSRTTNPQGKETRYLYNTYGKLNRIMDSWDAPTNYVYDNMLREKYSNHPLSRIESSYAWGDYGDAVYKITKTKKGLPTIIAYYDGLGRKIAEAEQRFDGRNLYTDYSYLPNGKVGFTSFPHTSAIVSSEGTFYSYDAYGRMTSQIDTYGKTSTWSYEPFVITSTIDGISRRTTLSHRDVVFEVEDASGYVDYDTDASGRVVSILHNGKETTIQYDDYGHITQTTDMQGTTRNYSYDANGYQQSVIQGTSLRQTQYDKYGRLLWQRFQDSGNPSLYTYYNYDQRNRLICDSSSNHHYTFEYDTYNRIVKETKKVFVNSNEESITTSYTYNTLAQLATKQSLLGTSGLSVLERNIYSNGWLSTNLINETEGWKLLEEDNKGNTRKTCNQRDTVIWDFDVYGHILSQQVRGMDSLSLTYNFDLPTGNLTRMANDSSYIYDNFNRLIGWKNQTFNYDGEGNLLNISPSATMTYNGYKLTSATSTMGFNFTNLTCDLSYLKSIERPYSIQENGKRVEFGYNGDRQRVWMKMYETVGDSLTQIGTRYYVSNNYEIDEKTGIHKRHYYYAGGTPYTAHTVVLVEDSIPYIHQIYRDNVGSIVMYAGRYGTNRLVYNPWGARLYSTSLILTYPPTATSTPNHFIRTYGSHEVIPYFGFLNANARIYNPYLGRFLSPDPILATSGNPLDFNPYIYGCNNPLIYCDPDGEHPLIFFALAAGIGGLTNVIYNADNIHNLWQGLAYFGVGAAAGVVGAASSIIPIGIGGAIGGAILGAIGGIGSGALLGAGNAALSGGDIWKSAFTGAWQGGLFGAIGGGITGGAKSIHNKGNFWTGAKKTSLTPFTIEESSLIPEEENNVIRLSETPQSTKPYQNHHVAPWNNKTHSEKYKTIADIYGLDLRDKEKMWNTVNVPHMGSHPIAYKDWVLRQMVDAHSVANGDKELFLQLFEKGVRNAIQMYPDMLDRWWWDYMNTKSILEPFKIIK